MFKNVLVIGSGTMGLGISSLLLVNGISVSVVVRQKKNVEQLNEVLQKNIERLSHNLGVHPGNCKFSLGNFSFKRIDEVEGQFDLIIEAVSESLEVKKSIINWGTHFSHDNTVWATNTSSLSVTELSMHYVDPSRFIGLHFFNPVFNMKLVEVVPSLTTGAKTIERCTEFCRILGKCPIQVEDSPGFIVNRLLIPMINEAVSLVETGIAKAEEIDEAMKLGALHPLGPLALADLIGNDVCLSIMQSLFNSTGDSKYRPSYLLQKMVSAQQLGRKTKAGFYSYK